MVGAPFWKIWKSIGMIIPNIWENKKWQPNHQPVTNIYTICVYGGFPFVIGVTPGSHPFRTMGFSRSQKPSTKLGLPPLTLDTSRVDFPTGSPCKAESPASALLRVCNGSWGWQMSSQNSCDRIWLMITAATFSKNSWGNWNWKPLKPLYLMAYDNLLNKYCPFGRVEEYDSNSNNTTL